MKITLIATIMALMAFTSFSQSEVNGPEQTLQLVFDVANSQEWSALARICDPQGEGDGDTRNICGIATADKATQDEFVEYFKTGKIIGDPAIEGEMAKVNFTFGPDGDKKETMNLVSRRGVWYLYSF